MRIYIIRRLLLMIPTIFFVSLIVFMLIRIIPGNVVDIMISQFGMAGTTQVVDRKAVEHELGWDVPFYIQYGKWVEGIVVHGDFGKSLWHQQSVLDEIKERWPVTFELGQPGDRNPNRDIIGTAPGQLVGLFRPQCSYHGDRFALFLGRNAGDRLSIHMVGLHAVLVVDQFYCESDR